MTKLRELLPGHYLYATRYPGFVPMVGFVWLEILPATVVLYLYAGGVGLLYPLLHCVFLAVYEIGYLINDRSATADERSQRVVPSISDVPLFILLRLALLGAIVGGLSSTAVSFNASAYILATLSILLLLVAHTWVGIHSSSLSRLRCLTFAWLAIFKYAPAALAIVEPSLVLSMLCVLFVCYGGGRVVAYIAEKLAPDSVSPKADIPYNAIWFFAAGFPLLVIFAGIDLLSKALLPLAFVFLSYYVVSGINTFRRRQR